MHIIYIIKHENEYQEEKLKIKKRDVKRVGGRKQFLKINKSFSTTCS